MNSFQSLFCDAYACAPAKFTEKVFNHCVYPHAALLAPFFGGFRAAFFSPDRDLIAGLGRASTLAQVREEVGDFIADSRNRNWLRHRLKLRVSTTRVLRLARKHFTPDARADQRHPQCENFTG